MIINWSTKAVKQLGKLKNRVVVGRIYTKVATLKNFPNVSNVKPLVNHDYAYRLRVGDYRVFFNVLDSDEVEVINIEEVKKRDERTY